MVCRNVIAKWQEKRLVISVAENTLDDGGNVV